jgi:hypothetical protein
MKSPRKRYHIMLPDAPPQKVSGLAYLALLIVAVNVLACLIAERAMVVAAMEERVRVGPSLAGREAPEYVPATRASLSLQEWQNGKRGDPQARWMPWVRR